MPTCRARRCALARGGKREQEIVMLHRLIIGASSALSGLMLAGAPASAQGYGYGGYYSGPADEEVIVTAPPGVFREQGYGPRSLDFPPERVSLSRAVHYGDLDLRRWRGATELRRRVVYTAHE